MILIYGAEIKRLLFAADQTRQMIAATDLDKVGSHPEEFAQHVGDLAGRFPCISLHW